VVPGNSPNKVRLASVEEMQSRPFVETLERLNALARIYGLREMTNWSKVWEYPWILLNGVASAVSPGVRICDLGSELSSVPWYLASLGAEVAIIETDSQYISLWDEIRRKTGWKVEWSIVDSEILPFKSESFSVVTSFSVIEHQQNKEKAISEVIRILKPGGIFGISFDICEPEMGMTFPIWNGRAITMKEFEVLLWNHPAFREGVPSTPEWNVEDVGEFVRWHLRSAPHHNYAVGASVLHRRAA
jgi:2-polyprenyl-3-methyl-5-hydroxy-6-metoxy-1,4-benzoquinol methylase